MNKRPVKHKYKIDIGTKDYYRYYKEHADSWTAKSKFDTTEYEFNENPIVDRKLFSKILQEYYTLATKEAMENNEGVHLPNLGTVKVVKAKPQIINYKGKIRLPIDWKTTKAVGKTVYFTNDDRDGYVYRWFWDKKNMKTRSLSWYKFVASRGNKRGLKVVLQDKTRDCFELEPFIRKVKNDYK